MKPTAKRPSETCIVVPCYNEEARFDSAAFERFLQTHPRVSFVLVNDGSTDKTLAVLEALSRRHPQRVRTLDVQPNGGKAEAVRRGMLLAMQTDEFDYAGFWDADLATPLDAIPAFVEVMERQADVDIVLGARVALLGRQIERHPARHYFGRIFATAASVTLAVPVYDTQCGAKLLRVEERTLSLFEAPFGSRWIFDVELLARYLQGRPGGSGIYELPLECWKDVRGSRVRPTDFVRAIGEIVAIYRKYRTTTLPPRASTRDTIGPRPTAQPAPRDAVFRVEEEQSQVVARTPAALIASRRAP
jgi:glycosyltransferase involved in cell wall biosynthesis